jgi:hypothetical protein
MLSLESEQQNIPAALLFLCPALAVFCNQVALSSVMIQESPLDFTCEEQSQKLF